MCEVVSPNFHALNSGDCTCQPQLSWDLGLGTPCQLALKWLFFQLAHFSYNMKHVNSTNWLANP
jgi:hypothetical protein